MKALEIIDIKERIAKLDLDITFSEKYLNHLYSRYTNPKHTINKYVNKIKQWRRERYELKKELVVLESEPCNE